MSSQNPGDHSADQAAHDDSPDSRDLRTDRADTWRSARRAAALQHHPDRGGSAAALVEALREVDRQHGRSRARPTAVTTRRSRGQRLRWWWASRRRRRRARRTTVR